MSVVVGASAGGVGKVGNLELASPSERQTDSACAAQDAATESQSQGLARGVGNARSPLDRLLDAPGPLDRFAATPAEASDRNSAW